MKATGWPGRYPRCGHVVRVKAQIAEEPAGGSWREKPQLRPWGGGSGDARRRGGDS